MATPAHPTTDAEFEIDGFAVIPRSSIPRSSVPRPSILRPSMPSSKNSFLSDETEAPLPLSMSASAALPGDQNSMNMAMSTPAAAATGALGEPRQDGAVHGCRNDTVQHVLDHGSWPLDPYYTATQHAEYGSSARAPTESSANGFVFVSNNKTDGDVAATGSWADQAMPRSETLDLSNTE